MPKIYHYPQLMTEEEFERCSAHLIRLQQNERGGLKLKKLEGKLPLYEIRLNIEHRVLLVKQDVNNESAWIIIEFVEFHRLQKARSRKEKVFKTLFGDGWTETLNLLDEDQFVDAEETLPEITKINPI